MKSRLATAKSSPLINGWHLVLPFSNNTQLLIPSY